MYLWANSNSSRRTAGGRGRIGGATGGGGPGLGSARPLWYWLPLGTGGAFGDRDDCMGDASADVVEAALTRRAAANE